MRKLVSISWQEGRSLRGWSCVLQTGQNGQVTSSEVTTLAWNHLADHILASGAGGSVTVWDLKQQRPRSVLRDDNRLLPLLAGSWTVSDCCRLAWNLSRSLGMNPRPAAGTRDDAPQWRGTLWWPPKSSLPMRTTTAPCSSSGTCASPSPTSANTRPITRYEEAHPEFSCCVSTS